MRGLVSVAEAAEPQYQPSGRDVVPVMLFRGQVKDGDVVFDLGCGDGRLVIAAAQLGARGVCVERDARMVREAKRRAAAAGMAGRIEFLEADLFSVSLVGADVVFLFLNEETNARLLPKLRKDLKPGARVVSHWYPIAGWVPDGMVSVKADGRTRPVYWWKVPQPGFGMGKDLSGLSDRARIDERD